jgi:tRNA threonylcarbamoyl adenosine modification protein (Sua5/YciO/YrdC/YwlC family)
MQDLVLQIKKTLVPLLNFKVTLHLKKSYKIKVGWILLLQAFLLVFGLFLGLNIAKVNWIGNLGAAIFSAPVFAAIVIILGYMSQKYREYKQKLIEKKLDIADEILKTDVFLKVEKELIEKKLSPEKLQQLANIQSNLIRYFNIDVIKKLDDFYFKCLSIFFNIPNYTTYGAFTNTINEDIEKLPNRKELNLERIKGNSLLINSIPYFHNILSGNCEIETPPLTFLIKESRFIIMETDTIPGIFSHLDDKTAAYEIFEIKKRPLEKPLVIYSNEKEILNQYAETSNLGRIFIEEFGGKVPITIILKAKSNAPELTRSDGFVGFRIISKDSEFGKKISGSVLVGTSANFSGENKVTKEFISAVFLKHRSLILINHENSYENTPSSVIKIDGEKLIILREGRDIESVRNWVFKNGGMKAGFFEKGKEVEGYKIMI